MHISEMIITIVCSVLASSGLWALIFKAIERKDVKTKVLIGLAHDRIIFLGMGYVNRGWITRDEYENLYDYLYRPYQELGGNGSAQRVMDEVRNLPIRSSIHTFDPPVNDGRLNLDESEGSGN